ncbi:cell division protein FtsZ [Zavarzinia compransoris]|uniref:Cell division protein FtsZ n=1 Tax=Zavarzinia compransoris TaxID=1264899 RepID=A0A317DUI9_9PROT|nr:cell division protein FtsZ [Zavarzinia compransoris]PWR18054.1 cell division protein FtsZ [Zavarzinia compransoris]TDP43476.1 cell division protein FtsZ [Zavarzinia compransoris]
MSISLGVPEPTELKPRITVFGVGGAGGNAVNNMIEAKLEGVEFVVANTDSQALANNKAPRKIQLGAEITRGLGAGSKPEVGRMAAEETRDQLLDALTGSNMVFITCGMGGGTGTGAAPVVARAAREQGILTVGVVTKPFQFEGSHRMRTAEAGIAELHQYVDTLIIIPNQNLFRLANEKTTFAQAFAMADNVLHSGVRGVTDLMIMPGLINLDFADVRTVMSEMGKAMMGTGEASGDKRAIEAAEAAISNPLLDDVSMKGARGVLINITGGMDMTLFEVDEAANRIRSEVDPEANIIVGSTFDMEMEGRMRVSVVATGIEADQAMLPRPAQPVLTSVPRPVQAPAASAPVSPVLRPAAVAAATLGATHAAPAAPAAAPQPAPVEVAPALPLTAVAEAPAPMPMPAPMQAPAAASYPPAYQQSPRVNLGGAQPIRETEVPAPKRSGLRSLIEKVTGAGPRAAAPEAQAREFAVPQAPQQAFGYAQQRPAYGTHPQAQGTAAISVGQAQPQAPMAQPQFVQPQPMLQQVTQPAPQAAQPNPSLLGRMEGGERGVAPRSSDDQLEIPAFLRRQAN